VTIFTGDLALLLRTGARINDALELLATDAEVGRMRGTIAAMAGSILSGESFGEALAGHPGVLPPIYVALAQVGEASGTLVSILDALSSERQRSEALRRRLSDALRYPAFLLFAAGGVMIFFLGFVLPQFANVFRDFNAKVSCDVRFVTGSSSTATRSFEPSTVPLSTNGGSSGPGDLSSTEAFATAPTAAPAGGGLRVTLNNGRSRVSESALNGIEDRRLPLSGESWVAAAGRRAAVPRSHARIPECIIFARVSSDYWGKSESEDDQPFHDPGPHCPETLIVTRTRPSPPEPPASGNWISNESTKMKGSPDSRS
jgi:hypothetical protein